MFELVASHKQHEFYKACDVRVVMQDLGGAQILRKQRHINNIYICVTYIECEVGSFSTKSKSFLGMVNGFLILERKCLQKQKQCKEKERTLA